MTRELEAMARGFWWAGVMAAVSMAPFPVRYMPWPVAYAVLDGVLTIDEALDAVAASARTAQ